MIKNLDNEKKVDILLSALGERYKSIHIIRDRMQSVCLWALGILFATGGWLIQSNIILTCLQKGVYITGILFAFAILRFSYLADLYSGFKSQQRVAVHIERTLGMFTPDAFNNSTETIYPKSWENAGTKTGYGKFFHTTYMLLYAGVAFLILTILLKGWLF